MAKNGWKEESMCHPHNLNELKYLRNFQFFYLLHGSSQLPTLSRLWKRERVTILTQFIMTVEAHGGRVLRRFLVFSNIIIVISPLFYFKTTLLSLPSENLKSLSSLGFSWNSNFIHTKPPTWCVYRRFAVYCAVERQLDDDDRAAATQRHTKNIVQLTKSPV